MRLSWTWVSCLIVLVACSSSDEPAAGNTDAGKSPDYAGDGKVRTLDRSGFNAISTNGHLDYATPEHWVCRPDIDPNECASNIDATEIKADGTLELHKHEPAAHPAFDCFYVYPTVWVAMTAQMTDFSETGMQLVRDALLSQAARFTGLCRAYAPMYRQAGLACVTLAEGADKQLALQDVRDAFAY